MKKSLFLLSSCLLLSSCTLSTRYLMDEVGKGQIASDDSPVNVLEIEKMPSRLTYFEGEYFDPTGLEMYAVMKNGEEEEVSIDELKYNKNKLSISDTKIEFTYLEKSIAIEIVVKKGNPFSIECENCLLFGNAYISMDSTASGGKSVGNISNSKGSGFTAIFESSSKTFAQMSLLLNGNSTGFDFGKNHEIIVSNDEGITHYSSATNVEQNVSWNKYQITTIEVAKGLNSITVINNGSISSYVDKIDLLSDATISSSDKKMLDKDLKIECEDTKVNIANISTGDASSNNPSNNKYISGLDGQKNASFRFVLKSNKSGSALLNLSGGRSNFTFEFFESHQIKVIYADGQKNEILTSGNSKFYSTTSNKGYNWTLTPLGEIHIREGYNVIEISNIKGGRSINFDYLTISPSTKEMNLDWFNLENFECEQGTVIGSTAKVCSKYDVSTSASDKTALDANPASNDGYIGAMNLKANNGFSYIVNAEKDTEADFIICFGLNQYSWSYSENHSVSVEDKDGNVTTMVMNNIQSPITTGTKWFDWRLFYLGKINLKAGNNTIKLLHTSTSYSANHDYFMLATHDKVTPIGK